MRMVVWNKTPADMPCTVLSLLAIIDDKLKDFGTFDKSVSNVSQSPFSVIVWLHQRLKQTVPAMSAGVLYGNGRKPNQQHGICQFERERRHVAASDFPSRFRTIIRGYEERVWMEFDTDLSNSPNPLSTSFIIVKSVRSRKKQYATFYVYKHTNLFLTF